MKTELDAAWESAIHNAERANQAEKECERLRAELAECRAGYAECISDLDDWASYASTYFQAKHDLAGDLAKHRAALAEGE